MSARRFENKTVLVSGASRGLGRTIAEAFAAEGAHVVVGYRHRAEEAAEVVKACEAAGASAEALALELEKGADIAAALEPMLRARGGVHVLVNNAGLVRDGFLAMAQPEDWDETISVNLSGAAHLTRALVRDMMRAGGGTVVNVASVSALRAAPGRSAYSASKAGLLALTRNAAMELIKKKIRVNAVVPGVFDAGMMQRSDPQTRQRWLDAIPAGRAGNPEELARAVLWLASEESSYVVGHALVVDGGLSL